VSERDEPGLDELERQLDATFASTRPRRGFEDELWRQLEARRRPWWRRLRMPSAGRMAGSLVALLAIGLVTVVVLRGGLHVGGAGGAASSTTAAPASGRSGSGAATSGQFGLLPAPPGAATAKLPPKSIGASTAAPQTIPASLPVYRYDKANGPAAGQLFDPTNVPSGLVTADYPAEGGPGKVVYVAVPDPTGPYGYLEPEYVAGDTSSLVPALAPSAYRG
jgi:hypothetical protein